jgi:hypothetical protein
MNGCMYFLYPKDITQLGIFQHGYGHYMYNFFLPFNNSIFLRCTSYLELYFYSIFFTEIPELLETGNRRSTFIFMVSYLLDVICARNIFPGLGLSWNIWNYMSMCILEVYGKIGIRNPMLVSVMNSWLGYTPLFSNKTSQDFQKQQRRSSQR